MTNFVYNGVALPASKSDVRAPSDPRKQWSADDGNFIFTALDNIRTCILNNAVNIKQFGVVGDGVVDDTIAFQNAINSTQGRILYIPKGIYKITSTLLINATANHWIGDFGTRNSAGGTEIAYSGTGPCIQIAVEDLVNSPNWNSNWYNGKQDHIFDGLSISHSAPDTTLASAPGAGSVYKANAYGIWDWYGGGIRLLRSRIEKFEANFVGIQSDINHFYDVGSHYSKYGLYLGPRSDQFTGIGLYSFLCDRAVTIDFARGARILGAQFVGCGHATASPIEYRLGSSGLTLQSIWFEHLGGVGYAGTDQQSFVSAGEVSGYGPGGSIQSPGGTPNTTACIGLEVDGCFYASEVSGNAGHTKYAISSGKCSAIALSNPSCPVGYSLTNFDSLVGAVSGTPSASDTQIDICGPGLSNTLSKNITVTSGTPIWHVSTTNSSKASIQWSSSGQFDFCSANGTTGTDALQLSAEGVAGNVFISAPNYATGQTIRFRIAKSLQTATVSTPPASGTWERGDRVWATDPVDGSHAEWICTTGGTPGTWRRGAPITGSSGFFSFPLSWGLMNEQAPAQITANQNDYSPGGANFTNCSVLLINSDAARDITGFATGVSGRVLWVYNNGTQNITLKHQNAGSVTTNRIIGTAGADVVLTPNRGVKLYYSPATSRWLVMTDNL